jgi:hypothetical protein
MNEQEALRAAREINQHPSGYWLNSKVKPCVCESCLRAYKIILSQRQVAVAAATPAIEQRVRIEALDWAHETCLQYANFTLAGKIEAEIERLEKLDPSLPGGTGVALERKDRDAAI